MDNTEKLEELRSRYREIISLFGDEIITFPLDSSPAFSFRQNQQIPTQDSADRFGIEIEILKAAGFTPEKLSAITDVEVDVIERMFTGELDYFGFDKMISSSQIDFIKASLFGYFISTIAIFFCSSRNYCDYVLVADLLKIDRLLTRETLCTLTGLANETIEAFIDNPSTLPDKDKFVLAVKLHEMDVMLTRLRETLDNQQQ